MFAYLTLLFSVVILVYLGRRYGSAGVRRVTLSFAILTLTIFAAVRDKTVGSDTANYVRFIEKISTVDDVFSFKLEPGFNVLVLLSGELSDSYALLLANIAFIVVVCYTLTIIRLVKRYEIAFFIFITLGTYTFFFNGARQGMAAAICFLALPCLLDRRLVSYSLLVGIAALFHYSALIALPIYFLATSRVSWIQVVVIIVSVVIATAILSQVAQLAATLIAEKYASYGRKGEGGGHLQVAFLLVQGAILFFFRGKVVDDNKYYGRLLNIYLIGLVPSLASVISSVNPSGMLRLTAYFTHTAILLWPMVFLNFRDLQAKVIFMSGFLVVALVYFVMTTSYFSNLTPYQINSELFW